jgi:AcrR family transcriptional regulator
MVRLNASLRPAPIELPMLGQRQERADAAANRERILCAARRLLSEQGPEEVTMQAVAVAAGVGKGTLFRRFGDRAGLTHALLDEYMREFQEGFLHGPPPLGPGAAPAERLEAFIDELVRRQTEHLELARAAEVQPGRDQAPVYGALMIHVAALVKQINPVADERILAGFILSAVAPPVLHQMKRRLQADTAELQRAAKVLLRGLTCGESSPAHVVS